MNTRKPKQLKFAGEDSFIVPKPGTKKFLMAIAQEEGAIGKINAINAEVAPMDNVTITNPTEVSSDVISTPPPMMITAPVWESLSCSQIQSELEGIRNMLMVSRFGDPSVYQAYQDIIAKGELVYNSKCGKGETPIDIIPPSDLPPAPPVYVEPSWDSMTCEQIKNEIANIQSQLPNVLDESRQILMMAFKNGTRALERCNVSETPIKEEPVLEQPPKDTNLIPEPTPKDPTLMPTTTTTTSGGGGGVGAPPITTITTTGTPIIATATAGGLVSGSMPKSLGGGAGGGGGAKEQPKKEKGLNLWWLVAAAAAIYLITRKK